MARRALNAAGEPNEAAWQYTVVGVARLYGWRIFHAPAGGKGGRADREQLPEGRGFPDLVMVRGPRLVFAELKTRTGKLGPGQEEWLHAFAVVGDAVESLRLAALAANGGALPLACHPPASVEAYLWRPADFEDVHAVLGRGQERRHDLDPIIVEP